MLLVLIRFKIKYVDKMSEMHLLSKVRMSLKKCEDDGVEFKISREYDEIGDFFTYHRFFPGTFPGQKFIDLEKTEGKKISYELIGEYFRKITIEGDICTPVLYISGIGVCKGVLKDGIWVFYFEGNIHHLDVHIQFKCKSKGKVKFSMLYGLYTEKGREKVGNIGAPIMFPNYIVGLKNNVYDIQSKEEFVSMMDNNSEVKETVERSYCDSLKEQINNPEVIITVIKEVYERLNDLIPNRPDLHNNINFDIIKSSLANDTFKGEEFYKVAKTLLNRLRMLSDNKIKVDKMLDSLKNIKDYTIELPRLLLNIHKEIDIIHINIKNYIKKSIQK
jgi:hypothetical protein